MTGIDGSTGGGVARVAVIGGGRNVEHEVSLASAAGIAAALERTGRTVDRLTIGRDGVWAAEAPLGATPRESLAAALLRIRDADVVFPALHGPLGEDGALAALCALADVRVVGSGAATGAVGMDKHVSKLVANAAGVRVAGGEVVDPHGLDRIRFTGPVVVKPVAAGSSHGVSLVREADELAPAIIAACAVDGSTDGGRALVEPFVRGREIDVAVLREPDGTRWAAPPLEIHAEGLFDTATKYDGSARFTVPAELSADEAQALERAALAVFDAFGCSGVARVDFFLTEEGPVFNEINTMPGMTDASQVPRMFRAAGMPYEDLIDRLVRGARRA